MEQAPSVSVCIFCPNKIHQKYYKVVDKEHLKAAAISLSNLFQLLELDMAEVLSCSGGPDDNSLCATTADDVKPEVLLVQFLCGNCVYLANRFGEIYRKEVEAGGGGGGSPSLLLVECVQMWIDRINGVSSVSASRLLPPHGGQNGGIHIIKSEILQCADTKFEPTPKVELETIQAPDPLDIAAARLTRQENLGGRRKCTLCGKTFIEDSNVRKHLIIQHYSQVESILEEEEKRVVIKGGDSGSEIMNPEEIMHLVQQPRAIPHFQPTPEQMLDDAISSVIYGPANIQHRRKRIFHCQLCAKECEMIDRKSHVMELHFSQVKNMIEAQYVRE